MNAKAQVQIENQRAVFDEQVLVATGSICDQGSSPVRVRANGGGTHYESYRVTRGELADLPQLGLHDRGGADEAAETGAVGAEDDRHVAGEVDGADGVGVVVDVRRMQAGIAAVGACP